MQDIITSILSGVVGGAIVILSTYWKERKKMSRYILKEKLEAYRDMLLAYHNAVAELGNKKLEQNVVSAHYRTKLIAPNYITVISEKFFKQGTKSTEVRAELIKAMRKDLSIINGREG